MVAVTGASKQLSRDEKWVVYSAVEQVVETSGGAAQWLTGAAHGVDVYAAECAMRLDPEAQHHIYIPNWCPKYNAPPRPCRHDRDGIRHLSRYAAENGVWMKWHWATAGHPDEAAGYRTRNGLLAVNCTHLLAFPRTPKEQRRSGTWHTVREGKRMERPIKLHPLDGSPASVIRPPVSR